MLVPLLNPMEAIKEGARAKLGDPVTLKLAGLGVRDMVAWSGGFLIIAGDFGDLNPEAIVVMRQGNKARILILSDDGKYPGRSDKNVFRGVWLQQANAPIGGGNGN